jgi:hypothetical protein
MGIFSARFESVCFHGCNSKLQGYLVTGWLLPVKSHELLHDSLRIHFQPRFYFFVPIITLYSIDDSVRSYFPDSSSANRVDRKLIFFAVEASFREGFWISCRMSVCNSYGAIRNGTIPYLFEVLIICGPFQPTITVILAKDPCSTFG